MKPSVITSDMLWNRTDRVTEGNARPVRSLEDKMRIQNGQNGCQKSASWTCTSTGAMGCSVERENQGTEGKSSFQLAQKDSGKLEANNIGTAVSQSNLGVSRVIHKSCLFFSALKRPQLLGWFIFNKGRDNEESWDEWLKKCNGLENHELWGMV